MDASWDRFGANPRQRAVAYQEWCEQWAAAALRLLKPGGHLLAFSAPRTYHRLACGIEDAGFVIRDAIQWWYGSGYPKSKDVALFIDKAHGHPNRGRIVRVVSAYRSVHDEEKTLTSNPVEPYRAKSDAARPWEGWGTGLKPAYEPIVMARKPLAGSIAENVLAYRTGGLNIDGCRIGTADGHGGGRYASSGFPGGGYKAGDGFVASTKGRWPANLVLSHGPGCKRTDTTADSGGKETVEVWECEPGCPVAELDRQSGVTVSRTGKLRTGAAGDGWGMTATGAEYDDAGGASRFFYVAKPTASERHQGLGRRGNPHPTVKPIALMRYLVRLVTPPGGLVLDPFLGSGTTILAALDEGMRGIGIEQYPKYFEIACA